MQAGVVLDRSAPGKAGPTGPGSPPPVYGPTTLHPAPHLEDFQPLCYADAFCDEEFSL